MVQSVDGRAQQHSSAQHSRRASEQASKQASKQARKQAGPASKQDKQASNASRRAAQVQAVWLSEVTWSWPRLVDDSQESKAAQGCR
jgi:hypothetical protein